MTFRSRLEYAPTRSGLIPTAEPVVLMFRNEVVLTVLIFFTEIALTVLISLTEIVLLR